MSVAARPHQCSVHPETYRFGSRSVCLCGGCRLTPSIGESASLKGKAKTIYYSPPEDEFTGDVSTEGLHPELDILWRTASAAQWNRNGRHKSPLSRCTTYSSQGELEYQPVRRPYAAEGFDAPYNNVSVDRDQRTRNWSITQASQPESSSSVNRNVKEPLWHWGGHLSGGVVSEESSSDDEILIPRTANIRRERRNRESRGLDVEERRLEGHRLAQEVRNSRWAEETAVLEQYVVCGSNLVTYAAGLDILKIVPAFDLCSLKVKNLPASADVADVGDIIARQGIPTSDFVVTQVYNVGKTREAVVLIDSQYRHVFEFAMEGIGFRQQALTFDINNFTPPNSMAFNRQFPSLSVSWEVMNKPLIATYRSPEEALRRAGELNGLVWKGRRLRVSAIESHPRSSTLHSVKIVNPPYDAETDFEFCCLVGTLSIQPSRGTSCDYLESLPIVCGHLQQQQGVLMHTLEVFPADLDGVATIQVNFDSLEDVRRAYVFVHNSRPGFWSQGPKLRAWRPRGYEYHYSANISERQYAAQKRLWDGIKEGRDETDDGGASILIEEADNTTLVSVLGDDQKAAGILKVRVESLIAGEELEMALWHPNFHLPHESKVICDRIYDKTGVVARTDFETQSLRVYGDAGMVEYARQLIEEEVQRLHNIATTKSLHRGTVAFFVREGIGRLKELIGEENVILDLASRPCTITVKGGQEALHHLQRLIEEARSADEAFSIDIDEDSVCPVCYTQPSNPEYLGCGHSYCAGCLQHFLSSAADSKRFPIVCLGNEATCNFAFPIPFLRRFLTHQAFQHLSETAFTCYIEQHPQEYRCCPTVDCKQVYRRQPHATSVQCPSCFFSICPACAEESHGDLTCEESHLQRDPAMRELVNEQLGFKKCPHCHAWIEKAGGCNHLQCSCGAHVCWRCMGVFSAGNIYAHMNTAHGGIHGEELPPDLDVGDEPDADFIAQQANALAQIEIERTEAPGRRWVNFWGRFQPARPNRYGTLHQDDDLVMAERRAMPFLVEERRRTMIAEFQTFYTRRRRQQQGV